MSETNGVAKGRKRMNKFLFFRLCEEMRNRREVLLTEKPTATACAKDMSVRLGAYIEAHQIKDAKEMTNIHWEPVKKTPVGKEEKVVRTKVIVSAVMNLYKLFDSAPPADLVEIHTILTRGTQPSQPAPAA